MVEVSIMFQDHMWHLRKFSLKRATIPHCHNLCDLHEFGLPYRVAHVGQVLYMCMWLAVIYACFLHVVLIFMLTCHSCGLFS